MNTAPATAKKMTEPRTWALNNIRYLTFQDVAFRLTDRHGADCVGHVFGWNKGLYDAKSSHDIGSNTRANKAYVAVDE